jgi:hypothetical protein
MIIMQQLGAMLSKLQKVSEEFNVAVLMTNQACSDKLFFLIQHIEFVIRIRAGHVNSRWSHVIRPRSKEGIDTNNAV